jgi:hypothetical protein
MALSWPRRGRDRPIPAGYRTRGDARPNFHWCSPLRGGFWPSCPEERGPPSHTTAQNARANTRELENPPSGKKRVAHNGSEPTLPPPSPLPSALLRPPFRDPLYTGDGARVCHWEFPKYISPCVLLSGEEWPEFHSFLHLFLRFHKRREGDRVSGSLFIIRRGATLYPASGRSRGLFSLASRATASCARHCGRKEKLGKIRVAPGKSVF